MGFYTDLAGRKHVVSFPEAAGCQGKPPLEQKDSSSDFHFGSGYFPSGEVTQPCGWVSWILILVDSVSSFLFYTLADADGAMVLAVILLRFNVLLKPSYHQKSLINQITTNQITLALSVSFTP